LKSLTTQDPYKWSIALLVAVLGFSAILFAQTGKRSEAGKVPAGDSTQNLSGVWVARDGQGPALLTNLKEEPPMTVWGKEQLSVNATRKDPHAKCDPAGVPRAYLSARPIEFIETANRVLVFYEEYHDWRQIWMDGRALPTNSAATDNGYSVGRWEGDTLVVETVSFNDRTWLDNVGHPHSEALHVTEHIKRINRAALQIAFTIEDPKDYSKPWTSAPRIFRLKPGNELAEDFCVPDDVLGISDVAKHPGLHSE
jgi:hypothetical protein